MNYIVLDLEWNQSPTGKITKNKNGILPFEIIEIGAVKLDKDLKILSSFDRLIKPKVYLKLHRAVDRLLPISMDDLEDGIDFTMAFRAFCEWCGEDVIFCTWGDSDLFQLQRNMAFYGINNVFPNPLLFLDLQSIYSEQFLKGTKAVALSEAVKALKIPKTDKYHRAIYDAKYTAMVMSSLNKGFFEKRYTIDTYRIPVKTCDEIKIKSNDMEQYLSKAFPSKEKVTSYKELLRVSCFCCNKNIKAVVKWFCDNGKNYYSLYKCDTHGYIVGKFKIKKNDKGVFYAVRTLSLTDNAGARSTVAKYKKEKERLRQRSESGRVV